MVATAQRELSQGKLAAAFPLRRWLTLVLTSWTLMHLLNLLFAITRDASSLFALGFWTCAKLVAWLLPTALLLRRRVGSAAPTWLGLKDASGLVLGLLCACAWLTIQLVGVRLSLPLFSRPQPVLEPALLLGALLVAPLFEELLFRGVMLRVLRHRAVRRELAVLASALAFALLHVPGWLVHRGLDMGIVGSFFGIALFGVLLGYLGWSAPSLWAPIFLHFANNLLSTGALGWLVRRVNLWGS